MKKYDAEHDCSSCLLYTDGKAVNNIYVLQSTVSQNIGLLNKTTFTRVCAYILTFKTNNTEFIKEFSIISLMRDP